MTSTQTVDVALTIGNNSFVIHSIPFVSPYTVTVTQFNNIQAPSNVIELKDLITVKNGDNAVNSLAFSLVDNTLSTGNMVSDFVTIEGTKLTIKNVPIDFEFEVQVEVFEGSVSKGVFSGNILKAINKYNSPDREDKTTKFVTVGDNNTLLGGDNAVDVNLSTSLTVGQTVTSVEVILDDNGSRYLVPAGTQVNKTIRALHVGEDTDVDVRIKVTFQDAGYTYIDTTVTIEQNIFVAFDRSVISYGQTGIQIYGDNTVASGVRITNSKGETINVSNMDDLTITLSEQASEYMSLVTNSDGETYLRVVKDVDGDTVVPITVTYQVYSGAVKVHTIEFTVNLTIQKSALNG